MYQSELICAKNKWVYKAKPGFIFSEKWNNLLYYFIINRIKKKKKIETKTAAQGYVFEYEYNVTIYRIRRRIRGVSINLKHHINNGYFNSFRSYNTNIYRQMYI